MNDQNDKQQGQLSEQDKLQKQPEGQQTGELQGDAAATTGGQSGREGFGLSGGMNSGTSHGGTGTAGQSEQRERRQRSQQNEGSDKGS